MEPGPSRHPHRKAAVVVSSRTKRLKSPERKNGNLEIKAGKTFPANLALWPQKLRTSQHLVLHKYKSYPLFRRTWELQTSVRNNDGAGHESPPTPQGHSGRVEQDETLKIIRKKKREFGN